MIISPIDPAVMPPDARLAEIADILATAYLRTLSKKESNCLELSCLPTAQCAAPVNESRAGEEHAA